MSTNLLKIQDAYVWSLVEKFCTQIRTKFPEATFEIGAHPTQRGAIIDVGVSTDDDFEVLDLVNPELDELLIEEDIAIYVRVLGPTLAERQGQV